MAAMDQVTTRLRHALQSDALPPEGRSLGHRLMMQLNQPTRISLIGLPGSGKTSLVNMLLGARLMPDLEGVAAVELAYGEVARLQITLTDGTINAGQGIVDQSRIPAGAVRVSQHLPDIRLKDWSFTEISLTHSTAGQVDLLDWMAKRADIAIWCSQQFDDRERALWSNVPEHLKDHSVLALTRADRLHMKGELTDRIARLQPIVADEFMCLYPIATLQGTSARRSRADQNEALWQSSGAQAFHNGIRQQVDQARTADLDHAYLLLERYKVAEHCPDLPPLPVATPNVQSAPRAPLALAQVALAPKPSGADAIMQRALRLLQGCADELLQASDGASGCSADRVLERCSTAAEELVQLLSDTDDRQPELHLLREDAIEGEQMIMLLRLERGETATEDALTVLLQLKKEMSAASDPTLSAYKGAAE